MFLLDETTRLTWAAHVRPNDTALWCINNARVQRTRVQIWLYENTKMRIEGQILGFDEYMNLVLDEAEEVSVV